MNMLIVPIIRKIMTMLMGSRAQKELKLYRYPMSVYTCICGGELRSKFFCLFFSIAFLPHSFIRLFLIVEVQWRAREYHERKQKQAKESK